MEGFILLDKIKNSMQFSSQALEMRAKRQNVVASNIANVDTPGYKAVDVDFSAALSEATGTKKPAASSASESSVPKLAMTRSSEGMVKTHDRHIQGRIPDNTEFARNTKYRRGDTASLDGNSVNIERERALFAENSVKFEASLRSLDGRIRTLKSAMKTSF